MNAIVYRHTGLFAPTVAAHMACKALIVAF
jgi:hypothetical protein